MRVKQRWLCACITLGATGLFVIFMWPVLLDCALSLQCNPLLYYLWKNVPYTLEARFYFFNWTNPEDIHNSSTKPKFEQVGPYVYFQNEEKTNVVWNDNGTVTFELRRFWTFDEERNNLTLQDKITNIDHTLLGISYVTRFWNYYIRRASFLTLSTYFSSIHHTRTVDELLFRGYPQPLMGVARALPMFDDIKLPPWNKIGYMYSRNGTTNFDGVFNMGTGSKSDLGKIYKWNYESTTEYYDGACGQVSGFSGQLFSSNLTRDPLEIFSSDLKRTISLQFEKEEQVKGIVGYKYASGSYMFDNGTMDPKLKCYCPDECMPSGLSNISRTRHNAPIFVSMPNFYGADPYYLNLLEGLQPEKDTHECYFIIEPTTGMILEGRANLQLNLFMQPVPGTNFFDDVPTVFIPLMWVQQGFAVSGKEVFLLKVLLHLPAISITLGILMILSSAVMVFYKLYKHEGEKKHLRPEEIDGNVLLLTDCAKH